MKYKVTLRVQAYVTYEVNARNDKDALNAGIENFKTDQMEGEFVTEDVVPVREGGEDAILEVYEPERA